MRITKIQVKNFKSLVDFELDLAKFSCLIGLNGSGKSTVLQFLDFASQLMLGDLDHWLEQRQWELGDLQSRLGPHGTIDFRISFSDEDDQYFGHWNASFQPEKRCCITEEIVFKNCQFSFESDQVTIKEPNSEDESYGLKFEYTGSILSQLKTEPLPGPIQDCIFFFHQIRSLDLLSPEQLRIPSSRSEGKLGLGGQNLAAFLSEIDPALLGGVTYTLRTGPYPQLDRINIQNIRFGQKQIAIEECYPRADSQVYIPGMETSAPHINDGMLRLIAILAELEMKISVLIFDEIENGINPELVEFVVDKLVQAKQQVLVTTHSPMILNYLEDATARDGVIYLYKTPQGHTRAIPFFNIPSISKKLEVMGPGEAFVDTDLPALADEIQSITSGQ